jgi:hypothetical protein
MGVLYDTYQTVKKKQCTMCGCIMDPKSLNHICECCLDDLDSVDDDTELHYYDET